MDQTTEAVATEQQPVQTDEQTTTTLTSDTTIEQPKELDFQTSIEENEKIILKALGIPPIMMDSGNNANIRPNMRMYYLETILPIVRKINHAMERYFGFELREDISNIPALQPELRDSSSY